MAKSKQQMQFMVLGGIVIGVILYVLVQFIVMPMFAELKETRAEIDEIRSGLVGVQRSVRDRANVQQQADEGLEALKQAVGNMPVPVLGNYMIGMEEIIRSVAGGRDIEISAVVSGGDPAVLQGGSGTFKIYQTRVIGAVGLREFAGFLNDIQQKYSYISVSGVTVIPQDETPERHAVTCLLSWLIWADPDGRTALLQE